MAMMGSDGPMLCIGDGACACRACASCGIGDMNCGLKGVAMFDAGILSCGGPEVKKPGVPKSEGDGAVVADIGWNGWLNGMPKPAEVSMCRVGPIGEGPC